MAPPPLEAPNKVTPFWENTIIFFYKKRILTLKNFCERIAIVLTAQFLSKFLLRLKIAAFMLGQENWFVRVFAIFILLE